MKNVVREGTGTAAALEGVEVAGKTGTAELNNVGLNQPWFIGFAGRHRDRGDDRARPGRAGRYRGRPRRQAGAGGTG